MSHRPAILSTSSGADTKCQWYKLGVQCLMVGLMVVVLCDGGFAEVMWVLWCRKVENNWQNTTLSAASCPSRAPWSCLWHSMETAIKQWNKITLQLHSFKQLQICLKLTQMKIHSLLYDLLGRKCHRRFGARPAEYPQTTDLLCSLVFLVNTLPPPTLKACYKHW